jgi:inner membrane protein
VPTAFTHGFVAAALVPLAPRDLSRVRLGVVLIGLAVLPDLDVIGLRLGIPYAHPLGHRGFSHSLPFAALAGLLCTKLLCPSATALSARWWQLAGLAALATASHGVLDAFTDAGLGIGFGIPFDMERHFFAWRPLATSPLSPSAFLSSRGTEILTNEIRWVWAPVAVVTAMAFAARRVARSGASRITGGQSRS